MAQERRGLSLAPGSWLSIGLIYLYGVLSSASLSKVIPILGDVGTNLGAAPAQLALLISLMTVLPALLASVGGSIIDRIGARSTLQLVALIGLAVNAAYLMWHSLAGFMAIRVIEGLIPVGAYAAAPALIMATTAPELRGRAMAFWSTYTPVGISLGLALSASFAGTAQWRNGYLVHMALFGLLAFTSPLLPHVSRAMVKVARPAGLFAVWTQAGPLRLSLTFATLIVMGFGMTTIYPEWFARQHALQVGDASNILSLATLVMIPGGFAAGALLARGWRDATLLAGIVLAASVASLPLFMPGLAEATRIAAMVAWMLAQGAAIAVVVGALPRVVADPMQGAAAAGLLSQLAALVTFVTPLIWQPILQAGYWPGFIAVVAVVSVGAWLLFPRRGSAG
jgi:predicted MFS family arabinose efflux permease